jgi:hypothetical protein
MRALRQELGDELPRFIVGSGFERRNPVSGLPAFSPETEEDEDDSLLDRLLGFFSGLLSEETGFPDRPQFPRDRRLEPLRRPEEFRDQLDRETQRGLEQQMRQPQFRGGGSSSPDPKRRNPFLDHQDEPLL